jgi:uncharacterized protein YqeY
MTLRERLEADMKDALRLQDTRRLSCIRMLRAKLLEREVALRGKEGRDYRIGDDEAQQVIASYAKQRGDSIESYRQAGREDLAAAEREELEIVRAYLPQQLAEAEIRALVQQVLAASGAASAADLGRVMKLVMAEVKGRADGKLVNRLVVEALSGR